MEQVCKICKKNARIIYSGHHGYRKPSRFDIYHCKSCDPSFASPMRSDPTLYDLIYSKAEQVPGYDRYKKYAETVVKHSQPFHFLAQSEDVYWAIHRHFEQTRMSKEARVLEVGCGMGYLTYSIARAGYTIRGLDLSQKAVDEAKARYGDYYFCADVIEYSKSCIEKYDVIILTEVIEHLTEITGFVRSLGNLLRPSGEILVTTPNKSVYGESVLWHTDPPPIHLWWLSETSLRFIAHEAGLEIDFIDFSSFNGKERVNKAVPTKSQTFDEKGEIIHREGRLMQFIRAAINLFPQLTRPAIRFFTFKTLFAKAMDEYARKSLSLCAVLKKPA